MHNVFSCWDGYVPSSAMSSVSSHKLIVRYMDFIYVNTAMNHGIGRYRIRTILGHAESNSIQQLCVHTLSEAINSTRLVCYVQQEQQRRDTSRWRQRCCDSFTGRSCAWILWPCWSCCWWSAAAVSSVTMLLLSTLNSSALGFFLMFGRYCFHSVVGWLQSPSCPPVQMYLAMLRFARLLPLQTTSSRESHPWQKK